MPSDEISFQFSRIKSWAYVSIFAAALIFLAGLAALTFHDMLSLKSVSAYQRYSAFGLATTLPFGIAYLVFMPINIIRYNYNAIAMTRDKLFLFDFFSIRGGKISDGTRINSIEMKGNRIHFMSEGTAIESYPTLLLAKRKSLVAQQLSEFISLGGSRSPDASR